MELSLKDQYDVVCIKRCQCNAGCKSYCEVGER